MTKTYSVAARAAVALAIAAGSLAVASAGAEAATHATHQGTAVTAPARQVADGLGDRLRVGVDPNSYPWRVGPSDWINDGHGYYEGECTSFAAWAIRSDGGAHSKSPDFLGNANQWTGASSSSTPQVGDVAQWDAGVNGAGSAGHVAYVAAVGSGTITVYEYNWLSAYNNYTGHALNVRTISSSTPSRYLRF